MAINNFRTACIYYMQFILLLFLYPIFLIAIVIRELCNRPQETQIKGEVAIITGAARGLGRQIAIELSKRGCHIAVVDILENAAEETATYLKESFNVKSKAYKVDISDHHQLLKFHREVVQDFGDVTILVHNAALLRLSDSNPQDCEQIQNMITINFTSQLWLNQLFLPRMKSLNRGHIMAISSCAALFPSAYGQIYGPTKSAVRAYMASLRADLQSGRYKIKLTTIMPTFLNTNQYTNDFLRISGYDKLMPQLDGTMVAQQSVEAMLKGLEEITLPRTLSLVYKLQEFLPTWLRSGLSGHILPKLNLIEIKNQIK
uniref:Uncharacterized protein n=1 Tax=Stomoxys calcitrans TaxID=35570 RepID=A0A1I8PZP2_STOCA